MRCQQRTLRMLVVTGGLALASGNTASAPVQPQPQALILSGSVTEGGVPSRFRETVDLARGRFKRVQQMGESESQSGYDGQPWDESNGIVMQSNLPSAVAQRRVRAWLAQQAWRESRGSGASTRNLVAPGGVPVTLEFEPATGRLKQATIAGDWGPILFTYSDWRRVGRFTYPFRREEVSPVGEHTITEVTTARLASRLPAGGLARPVRQPHGEALPSGQVIVPFEGLGARKSHILVNAKINGVPARLIFDTGAANYLTTQSAPRFGVHPTGGVNLSGVGEGSEAGGYATVDRIALGDAVLRRETIVVGPSPFPPGKSGEPPLPDGFTGFEFFGEYVTTIDYGAEQLAFRQTLPTSRRALRVPFYNDGSHIYVRGFLNGVDGYFGLDTGDGGTVTVFPAFAARLGIQGRESRLGSGGVGGAVREAPGVIDRFRLGGLEFRQLPARFSQNRTGAFASRSIAGNLGSGVLRCFRITIAFASHMLLLEPVPDQCRPGGTVSPAR